jgi:hypothetical protein
MREPRRKFLWCSAAVFSSAICATTLRAQARQRHMPTPPPAADPTQNRTGSSSGKVSQRAEMQQHEKEFRDALARLSEHVSQLSLEVQQAHSSDIFSVKIYKQASEIEHLAKQLKTLAKG